MILLGIYHSLYGDAPMTAGRALLISAVGFLVVFAVLGLIALFVKGMGKGFDAAAKKKKAAPAAAAGAHEAPAPQTPAVPEAPGLPENESAGTLKLTGVTEEEAAVVMAVVSHNSGIPLNRLRFNSITAVEQDGKETK